MLLRTRTKAILAASRRQAIQTRLERDATIRSYLKSVHRLYGRNLTALALQPIKLQLQVKASLSSFHQHQMVFASRKTAALRLFSLNKSGQCFKISELKPLSYLVLSTKITSGRQELGTSTSPAGRFIENDANSCGFICLSAINVLNVRSQ